MKNLAHIIFSVSGLSFWFFLGFPFANYHESYDWIAQVQTTPTRDLIFSYVGHFASYRPMGQLLAIFLYKNIYHSMLSIQIFNYLVSILGLLFILKSYSTKALPLFISFFLIGSMLFPTFNYLFHLNGFFYSPLALLLGVLYYFSQHEFSFNSIIITYFITIIAALFHSFAIIIFIAFLLGWSVENKKFVTQRIAILCLSLIISLIILVLILVREPFLNLQFNRLIGSYYLLVSIEHNRYILLLSFMFTIVTIYTISNVRKTKIILLSTFIFVTFLFLLYEVPLITLVILACLLKLIHRKKWSLVSLILTLILFPLFAGTVSSSLKFLILYILPVVIVMDLEWPDYRSQYLIKKIIVSVPVLLFIVLILLKFNIQIPVISRIANPILTEREKTFQLENAIEYLSNSGINNYSVEFLVSSNNNRFPASNTSINAYLESLNPTTSGKSLKVFICFDSDSLGVKNTLYKAEGIYSKNIHILQP